MVKRYSHTAVITISTGSLVKGEWVTGKSEEIEIKGQYFPSSSGSVKKNMDGEERPVHGEFSTKARPLSDVTIVSDWTQQSFAGNLFSLTL